MADYYGYLASISAVLGGFALTFFGVLLTSTSGRASAWTAGLSAAATGSFAVAALGWALAASGLAIESSNGAPQAASFVAEFRGIHRLLSLVLIGGLFLFLSALGTAGWIRSRTLGLLTATIATTAILMVFRILSHFIN